MPTGVRLPGEVVGLGLDLAQPAGQLLGHGVSKLIKVYIGFGALNPNPKP